jgi:hypothetical protein
MLWRVGLPVVTAALLAVVLIAGSGAITDARPPAVAVQPAPTTTTTAATTTTIPKPAFDATSLPGAVTGAVNRVVPHTDLGFAMYDEETGKTIASINADEPFYTASLVKLFIALDALHTGGWHAPGDQLRASLTEMISASHDGIADTLWDSGGRSAIVTRMVKLIGLTHTKPPALSDQWEMTSTTANDLVAVYRYLTKQVPAEASAVILAAMAAAKNPAADGFPQYFGIPDGLPGEHWAIKQGWMKIRRAMVLNTTGLVDSRYVVVLLTELPLSTSYAQGRAALTAGIAAVAPVLSG